MASLEKLQSLSATASMKQPTPHHRASGVSAALPRIALLLVFLVEPGTAQVFKCNANGGAVYQDTACSESGQPVTLHPAPADAAARAAARRTAKREAAFVEELESQREQAKHQAEIDRRRVDREKEAKAARCARYITDAERADQAATTHLTWNRHKREYHRKARELRDRHFSECFSAG